MTRARVYIQPLAIQERHGQASTQDLDALKTSVSPDWKSPKATSAAAGSFNGGLCSSLLSQTQADALSPVVVVPEKLKSPPCWQPSVPTEIWDSIAHECEDVATLLSFSRVCKATHFPAQRGLLRHLTVEDPSKIQDLMNTLLRKPNLGRSTRSLTIKLGKPVAGQTVDSNDMIKSSNAQEVALLGLLPLISRTRHVRIECQYNMPESLVQLLTCTLPEVRSVTVCSAFGYNRLVYMTSAGAARLIRGWKHLHSLSLSMPWVLPDFRGRHFAMSQFPTVPSSLRSMEISGFRGSEIALKEMLDLCQNSLRRLVFDCPIDEEAWYSFETILKPFKLQLEALSLWSWTMDLPLLEVLQVAPTADLRQLTLVTPALEELASRLPPSLEVLTLCTHPDFAPFEEQELVKHLSQHAAKSNTRLSKVWVYNPSTDAMDLSALQSALAKYSVEVAQCADTGLLG